MHTFSGARAFRRSQTMIIGDESSSEAVTSLVACGTSQQSVQCIESSTHVIRVPSDSTHASPTTNSQSASGTTLSCQSPCPTPICQGYHLSLAPQIPDDSISGTAGASQHVLDLLIPCNGCNLIELGAPSARCRRVWFAGVFKVPNVDLRLV